MMETVELPSGEIFHVDIETNDGLHTIMYLGKKEEIQPFFKKMNKKSEPLKIIKVDGPI